MEIKCNLDNNFYNYSFAPRIKQEPSYRGVRKMALQSAQNSADKFVRPVASKSATGLFSLKNVAEFIKTKLHNYKRNISHTYEHKIVFGIIEKELFGKRSIDSITHDLDKLIMYMFGFSKPFVTKFHRKHSRHHVESGKKLNLRSMICDNIASSPAFKPEKHYGLREFYEMSPELQSISGFGEALEKCNFGEGLDFTKINKQKEKHTKNIKTIAKAGISTISAIIMLPFKLFM